MKPIPGRGHPGRGRKGETSPPTGAEAPQLRHWPADLHCASCSSSPPALQPLFPKAAPGTTYKRRWRGFCKGRDLELDKCMFQSPLGHLEPLLQLASQLSPVQRQFLQKRYECSRGRRCRAGSNRGLLPPRGELLRGSSEPLRGLNALSLRQFLSSCADLHLVHVELNLLPFSRLCEGVSSAQFADEETSQRAECLPHPRPHARKR